MAATTLLDRALVRLAGDDVRGFLQGLVTQDLDALTPDGPLWAGLLTPQGKVLFDFLLWEESGDVLLDCEAEAADPLIRRLLLYRLRRPVEIGLEKRLHVAWAPEGEGAPDPRLAALGRRWLSATADDDASEAWRAHRLRLGVTEGRRELGDGTTLWLECNARELNGVSFTKGCYVGQENTARMNYRNKVNRRLVIVPAEEASEAARIVYPAHGLAVEHRRVESIDPATAPAWLTAALS